MQFISIFSSSSISISLFQRDHFAGFSLQFKGALKEKDYTSIFSNIGLEKTL